ncbi:MAG: hypothetical protein Q9217_002223 [Psora testacea]
MASPTPIAFVMGRSRGIGRQKAIDLAKNDYIARKMTEAGGTATAIPKDVRSHESVCALAEKLDHPYGQPDVLICDCDPSDLASIRKPEVEGRFIVLCLLFYSRFFRGKTVCAIGKVGTSVLVEGWEWIYREKGEEGNGRLLLYEKEKKGFEEGKRNGNWVIAARRGLFEVKMKHDHAGPITNLLFEEQDDEGSKVDSISVGKPMN